MAIFLLESCLVDHYQSLYNLSERGDSRKLYRSEEIGGVENLVQSEKKWHRRGSGNKSQIDIFRNCICLIDYSDGMGNEWSNSVIKFKQCLCYGSLLLVSGHPTPLHGNTQCTPQFIQRERRLNYNSLTTGTLENTNILLLCQLLNYSGWSVNW